MRFKTTLVNYIKWIARIWSILSLLFISVILFGHIFENEGFNFNSKLEFIWFLFFPIGVYLGLIISWKLEGVGGLIIIGSLLSFHILSDSKFNIWIDGISFPGLLFLIYWIIKFYPLKSSPK